MNSRSNPYSFVPCLVIRKYLPKYYMIAIQWCLEYLLPYHHAHSFQDLLQVNSKSQERCFLPKYGTDSGNDRFHVLKQFFWYELKYPFLRHKNVELQFRPILESYQLQVASGSDQPNLFPLHYSSICLNIY